MQRRRRISKTRFLENNVTRPGYLEAKCFLYCLLALLVSAGSLGCWKPGLDFGPTSPQPPEPGSVSVPEPLNLLLPAEIKFHPFTRTRILDENGGVRGINVRIKAIDAYGDSTKAFGNFRFEMYEFRPNSPDRKGKRLATWHESIMEPGKNLVHWEEFARAYQFKLKWNNPVPAGQRFVLVAVFSSPFSQRLFAEGVFVSGE